MTQRLHLVSGGEVPSPRKILVKAVTQTNIAGMSREKATACAARKAGAQRRLGHAHLRPFIAPLHIWRDDGQSPEALQS